MTQLEVTCPECGAAIIVDMVDDRGNTLPPAVEALLHQLIGEIKHYAFEGDVECAECGKKVLAVLTVSTHE